MKENKCPSTGNACGTDTWKFDPEDPPKDSDCICKRIYKAGFRHALIRLAYSEDEPQGIINGLRD